MIEKVLQRFRKYIASALMVIALIVTAVYSIRDLFNIYLHRLLMALRECGGLQTFESLSRAPRHVCLAVARPCRSAEVEKAVKTLHAAGCERVTVCHDGSLVLSADGYSESVTVDMGRSGVVALVNQGLFTSDKVSYPDAVLVLSSKSNCFFSTSSVHLENCIDASIIYHSELIPVYSLNPSDVYLAVSLFQSKSQRFGK